MISVNNKFDKIFCDEYFEFIKVKIENRRDAKNNIIKLPEIISNNGDDINNKKLRALLCKDITLNQSYESTAKKIAYYHMNNGDDSDIFNKWIKQKHKKIVFVPDDNDFLTFSNKISITEAQLRDFFEETKRIKKYIDYKFITNSFTNKDRKSFKNLDKYSEYRDKILDKLDVKVCPYCNRNFVDTFNENGKTRSTAQLDHFHSQNRHPYLALSLYNFIPSCSTCNSKFKGDNVDTSKIVYPYNESFSTDCIFEVSNATDVLSSRDFDIVLINNAEKDLYNKIEKSMETFRIKNVYQNHKEDARDLLLKKQKLTKKHIKDLENTFGTTLNVDELIFGVYDESNDLKKPISKFKRDIFSQKQSF